MSKGDLDSFGGLTREQKIQRLRSVQIDATNTAANVFSSDVATRKRRYICGMLFTNSDASPRFITVNKVLTDNTSENFLDSFEIDATGDQSLNQTKLVDVDNPFLVLTGQQNLELDVDSAHTIQVTVWWYDDPL